MSISHAQKYRKKPVTIEAMRFPDAYPEGVAPSSDGYQRNLEAAALIDWLGDHIRMLSPEEMWPRSEAGEPSPSPEAGFTIDPADGALWIATLEGPHRVNFGDWVIRGVAGEFYPIKDAIFRETYGPEDAAFEEALPHIEKEIRAQVAADIWEYWDACGDLIDDRDSARQAIDAIAAQIAKGTDND